MSVSARVTQSDGGDWFTKTTYGDLVDRSAVLYSQSEALRFRETAWTFEELRTSIDTVARSLLALGVRAGEVVAVWMPNRPEWIMLQFAVAKIGAVFLPVNATLREDDCRYILRHSECKVLLFPAVSGPVNYIELFEGMASDLQSRKGRTRSAAFPDLRHVVVLDHEKPPSWSVPWGIFLQAAASIDDSALRDAQALVSPNDLATIMYTSGTTGAPKGVMHNHSSIRNVTDQANRLNVRETDRILMYLPLFHAYAMYNGPILSMLSGARLCLMERFDPTLVLSVLEQQRTTMCFGFATHFHDLLEADAFPRTDLSALRAGIMAVGPISMEALSDRVQAEFGGKIVSGYGMTEIGVGATLGFLDEDAVHAATSGYPLPGYEFRIVDPHTGVDMDRGTPGEVKVRTYQMTMGYLKDPEQTAAAIDSDGWLSTGDIGVRLDDGYIRILGRFKDILRVGGENVDPAEVEAIYANHPLVSSAVVVGVPDARLDEVACLCVVLAPGAPPKDILAAELLAYADKRLAAYKRPRHLVILESVPKTPTGKVQRHVVSAIASRSVDGEQQ